MTLKPSLSIRLPEATAERVARNHDERITELQGLPSAALRVIAGVSLPDSTNVLVAHGLGRRPTFVRESTPRGASSAGRIDDTTDDTIDRKKYVRLMATGWGATITVDVQVM